MFNNLKDIIVGASGTLKWSMNLRKLRLIFAQMDSLSMTDWKTMGDCRFQALDTFFILLGEGRETSPAHWPLAHKRIKNIKT